LGYLEARATANAKGKGKSKKQKAKAKSKKQKQILRLLRRMTTKRQAKATADPYGMTAKNKQRKRQILRLR
jgi:hypothetical protein